MPGGQTTTMMMMMMMITYTASFRPDASQAHIIAPFNDVFNKVVLAILNSNGLEPITWQQINLRIDSRGLGIGNDARTSDAAFAASFLLAVKAATEIYPILHGDIIDGGSIPYVKDFCKCFCILQLQGPLYPRHGKSGRTNTGPMMPLIHSSRCSRILKVPIGSSRKGFDSILMITLAMLPYSTAHVFLAPQSIMMPSWKVTSHGGQVYISSSRHMASGANISKTSLHRR